MPLRDRVKLYKVKYPPSSPWMVRYRVPGMLTPKREYFATRTAATARAAIVRTTLDTHGTSAFCTAPHEIAELRAAREILPAHVSLAEAARFYLKHQGHAPQLAGPTLREAWVQFIETRMDASPAYRAQLESQCEPLLQTMGWNMRAAAAEPTLIEDMIASSSGAQETKANRRRMLGTFFKWTAIRYTLARDPMLTVRHWKVARGSPRFYQPHELRRLFEVVAERCPWLAGGLAVRAFAGVREIELRRMVRLGVAEDDIRPDNRTVLIRAEVAKATGENGRGRPRLLEALPPTLWQWLQASPRLWWPANAANTLQPCYQQAGLEPIKNGLRHSFVTYAAAWYESLDRAAKVAGHDTGVLRTHYMGLATKAQAEEWFAISPKGWQETTA